jgi:type III restriction enzyme
MKKRQEIGRGLRLPVDIHGKRVYDPLINVLTVIANESYQEYAGQLQKEFIDAGYAETPETDDAREKRIMVNTTKNLKTDEFKELWARISRRTKYNLELKTKELIDGCVEKINSRDIKNLAIVVEKRFVYFDEENKIETTYGGDPVRVELKNAIRIGNILERIAKETNVTKNTVYNILSQIDNLDLIFENPEEFTRAVIVIIKETLNNVVINEGLKYIPTGEAWEVNLLFSDFEAMQNKSFSSKRSVFDRVVYDSEGEKKFAEALENNNNVKLYTKLPRGFFVDTPFGKYIPDWAIVWQTEKGDKLYLVRETKFSYKDFWNEISEEEKIKIICGQKHFKAINVDFNVSIKESLDDLEKGQLEFLKNTK